MPDVIRTLDAARSLLERLAATIPDFETTARVTPDGWIPEVVDVEAFRAHIAAEKAAARFLCEAVDWDAALLSKLAELELPLAQDDLAGIADFMARNAVQDPLAIDPDFDGRSPAWRLADRALSAEPIDPDNWRTCDRDAALELLPFVAKDTHRDVERARVALLMLEPALPDRRVRP